MLTEEALIVLAAIGACGLLILGVLELVWPTRPKHPVRGGAPAAPRAARPHRQSALTRHTRESGRAPYVRRQEPLTPPAVPLAPLPLSLRSVSAAPGEPVAATPLEPVAAEPVVEHREAVEPVATEPVVSVAGAAPTASVAPPPDLGAEIFVELPAGTVVEACFALYQEQRYAQVLERAAGVLTAGPDGVPPHDAQEVAALWSVVALARQALGEDLEARTALENAIAGAPAAERPAYERQLAALAESVAKGLLADAQRHARPDSEECLTTIRSAVAWLERGVAAAPNAHGLAELIDDAQAMLWPAWQRTVMALVQRQEFRPARRLLREALADARFPESRAETFKELFSGTFSGEIGQLTAQAIRSMQEARESDALASLQRAETLMDTLSDEALPAARRDEVDRRLWWGYNRLGARRVEAADYEAALEPLFHALDYDVGPARRQETVALLVRALDGVADEGALAVRELAEAGDREAALVHCDKLWALLRSATDMGLAPAELAAVSSKVRRLFDSLGYRQP